MTEVYLENQGETSIGQWSKKIGVGLAALLLLVGTGMVMKSLMTGQPNQKKRATTISIVVPDTPPPPPPPPKEPPKEQPKEIAVQPKPQEAPPQAQSLKMEGAAGDGGGPFAAGAVSKDYIGGKAGLSAYRWYTDQIGSRLQEALSAQKGLAKARYNLPVHIWLGPDGKIERAELQESSGDPLTDELIRKEMAAMEPIVEAPPNDMVGQRLKLRIKSVF